MRYVLIDRITALVPGHSLTAIKSVSHGDDLVTRYGPGLFALPAAMVLEAMAQAAGLLIAATTAAPAQPVLAKVQPFTAYGEARPGDRVAIRAELEELRSEGCRTRVSASIDDRALADATIYLALVALEGAGAESRAATLRCMLADLFPGWFP
jgi:3-hydroxyacyl-[acyl-carrier-protein] dehydratase